MATRLPVTAVLLAALWSTPAQARPCPPNAVLLWSEAHGYDVCACALDSKCEGAACIAGDDRNKVSFRALQSGFPITCLDCKCAVVVTARGLAPPGANVAKQGSVAKTADGRRYIDYPDELFHE